MVNYKRKRFTPLKRQDFFFHLPDELIAQQPATERSGSRLLVVDPNVSAENAVTDAQFPDLINYLQPNDLLVFNNTKVIPARLFGQKSTGGKIELLIERVVDEKTLLSHIRSSKSPKSGAILTIENAFNVEVVGRDGALFILKVLSELTALELIEAHGHMPLPPYIERAEDIEADKARYQTVYSTKPGAVAAPTAGLHFDEDFLEQIQQRGVQLGFVTLHVGAGTFKPVQVDNIAEHVMHSEYLEVDEVLVDQVKTARAKGGRVIAVGTTSVRCLESATKFSPTGEIAAYQGETDIFITPGYEFKQIDALLTNFHLPESTLIMLVSALAGYQHTMLEIGRASCRERV